MLTLAAALHRRALLSASTRRRAPRKVPEARLPTAIALAYTQHLHGLVDALEADTRAAFERVGLRWDARSVRADAAADGDGPSLLAGDASKILARLRAAASERLRAPSIVSAVEGVTAGIVGFTREEFARQMRAALGIDLTTDPVLTQQRAAFRRENIELIRSLTTDHVERVSRVLQGGAGERVEVLRARIMGETGVVKSRASLIARDQVLKLNADVSHARHQAAGITEYIWRTSRDERVREAHRDLDGQRFRYDSPPVVDVKDGRRENPGGDFQCRCTAEPVLPDFGAMVGAPTSSAPTSPAVVPPAPSLPRPEAAYVPSAVKTLPPPPPAPGPVRVRYSEPFLPLSDDDLEETRRSEAPLAHAPSPSFEALPVEPKVQGVYFSEHRNARVQYPENRVGDDGFDNHVSAEAALAFETVAPESVKALSRYTGSAYKSINGLLRYGEEAAKKSFGAKAIEEAPAIIKGAKEALAVLPKAPADMVLFRGAVFRNVASLDELAAASEFESPAFLSTSRDPKVAVGFGGGEFGREPSALYRIKRHQTGAVLPRTHSNPAEAEVLFPPGTRFRIVGRQRVSASQIVLDVEEI